jgi:capsular polysaccharide export protein
MKIAIVNSMVGFLDFFMNLSRYLNQTGTEVHFINPDLFIKKQLKNQNLSALFYDKSNNSAIEYYTKTSDLIKYYALLYKVKNKDKIVKDKNREYVRAFKFFKENKFDYVLIFNGAGNVETDVCKNLNLNRFYFEQGYFPDTMQMDNNGVNCNTAFANLSFNDFLNFKYPEQAEKKISFTVIHNNISKSDRYFLRFLNKEYRRYFFNFLLRSRNLLKAKQRFQNFPIEKINYSEIGKYIFFPLQVNTDTQIVLNSPYDSMYEAVNDILPDLLKTGLKIIIKEHPFEVEPVSYSELLKYEQVLLIKKADIDELIVHSEFVVNVNSSVGLQAVSKYKKVLLLGDAFYKNNPITKRYSEIKGKNLVSEMNQLNAEKIDIDNYITHFKNKIFINGHIKNLTAELFEDIRRRLI